MANTVSLKIKIDDDGSLSIIAKEAKKAKEGVESVSKATNKGAKASDNYSKKNKGVAQATSNGTKAFSKMTTGITGGLVPAYATLAANVFALSAAFNFFKRAADVSILEKSQTQYAGSTGVALKSITAGLREASGGMLGFREAAEAAAIGVAKGFRKIEGHLKTSTHLLYCLHVFCLFFTLSRNSNHEPHRNYR